ncbi:Tox-REase-5 domain-containing protein [Luteolibacter luteus]|uniref:Tox-REase-5 domain-containing protein n=1 Tax=Luteolibacter luteus TaxID=2728835 RepID=A0A858RR61_9BACT|nr:Tox-REase-5 domain-containing protein [Luteolibacter luteus]QJE99151.1 hypothetical protein HHL09_26340 [Luteolibacter luteus]
MSARSAAYQSRITGRPADINYVVAGVKFDGFDEERGVLLEAIVYAWEPDDAVATSPQLIAQRGGGKPWLTKGWLNYSKTEGVIDYPL